MAGGLLTPMTQLMVARVAGKQLARVMGYTAIPILFVPALGPVVAGALLKVVPWPWLFYLNLPVGALAVTLGWFFLPGDSDAIKKRPLRPHGFSWCSRRAWCAFSTGSSRGRRAAAPAAVLAGVGLIAAFLWRARRMGSSALVDLALFGNGTFTAAVVTMFFFNGTSVLQLRCGLS